MFNVTYHKPHHSSAHPQDWTLSCQRFESLQAALEFAQKQINPHYKTSIRLPIPVDIVLEVDVACFLDKTACVIPGGWSSI